MRKNTKKENPFLQEMEPLVLKKKMIVQEKTNKGRFGTTEEFRKVKVYTSDVQEFTMLYKIPRINGLLKELTPMASKVMLYVMFNVEEDVVDLKRELLSERLGISLRSVSSAISLLVAAGVIRKKDRTRYWINPEIFFSGNRKDYICNSKTGKYKIIRDKNPEIQDMNED